MSAAKKIGPVFDDQINAKIQRKFDLIFIDKNTLDVSFSNAKEPTGLNESINFDVSEMVMESNKKDKSTPTIGLDLSADEEAPAIPTNSKDLDLSSSDDDGLGFSLDFDMETPEETSPVIKTALTQASAITDIEDGGFTLEDSDIGDVDFNKDATQKTIMIKPDQMQKSNLHEFKLEKTSSNVNLSIDMMSNEEAKTNIEMTIKDIIRPPLSGDAEASKTHTGLSDVEDSDLEFSNTPSKGFALAEIGDDAFTVETVLPNRALLPELVADDDDSFDLDGPTASSKKIDENFENTNEFDINYVEPEEATRIAEFSMPTSLAEPVARKTEPTFSAPAREKAYTMPDTSSAPASMGMGGGASLNAEDSIRFQATIRALREEREEMLLQIKTLKGDSKELEQDNLTLKANLDEAKIEITILRKRQMVELEDLKYRLALSDEKKAMSDEKARQADMRREKLEQKVRIDFNQVKQREKELESKLELLSMDVDSQVQSREQKILELRRKIDALEFNMENASIKEQKSLDDKRKLEDRLNKIMKTLRHSIKNLEDDIDQVDEDSEYQKDKN